jgi:hypothetical protein
LYKTQTTEIQLHSNCQPLNKVKTRDVSCYLASGYSKGVECKILEIPVVNNGTWGGVVVKTLRY